jgi:hypothetical protein
VPIPFCFSVSGHGYAGASFSADADEFAAWAEYTEATVEDYEHNGEPWSSADANVNGLPLQFAVKRESAS